MALLSRFARSVPACLVVAVLLGSAGPAAAQFSQYVAPGQFEPQREPLEERLRGAMQESKWRFGRWYFDPWVGLRNISRQDNLGGAVDGESVSDLTVTVGAGVRAYRPVGGDMTFAFHVLPEYVWWQELSERSRLNGRFGAGLFGNFGRIGLELSAQLLEDARFFSREVEEPVNTSDERTRVALEVELGRGASLFGEAGLRTLEFESEDGQRLPQVSLLDREETTLRAGVRYRFGANASIGLGVQESDTKFEGAPAGLDPSNSGSGPFLNLSLDRERLYLAADIATLELTADQGPGFVDFEETTGRAAATFRFSAPVELELFADRNLVYSLQPDYAYFLDSRTGVGLQVSLSSRFGVRGYTEEGENDYERLSADVEERSDDVSSWGVALSVDLGRARLTIGTNTSTYTSNLAQFDRDFQWTTLSLALKGGSGSPWG